MNKNTNKGITLIALVITIIVMLILVAVTITMAVNGGLFDYARKASSETRNAINEEQELANLEANMTVDEMVEKYTSGNAVKINVSTMEGDLAKYLGQQVNYGVTYTEDGQDEWEIFYADKEHIYLITKGYLAEGSLLTSGYNGISDFTAENGLNKYPAVEQGLFYLTYDPSDVDGELQHNCSFRNMKATQYLLDSTVWSQYVNNFADWCIGGPTMELFKDSFNEFYPEDAFTVSVITWNIGYDYPIADELMIPAGTYLNRSDTLNYWLACPSNNDKNSLAIVLASYQCFSREDKNNEECFRPIIALKSNVEMTWNEATKQYDLELISAN